MVSAYLVTLPPGTLPQTAVFLDCARAVEYAAAHRGSIAPLVLASELDKLKAQLAQIKDNK